MLNINTEDLSLQIEPVASRFEAPGGPYLEWIDLFVKVVVPGIDAEGNWSAMPGELKKFWMELQSMKAGNNFGTSAILSGTEPGLGISLRILERGLIIMDWSFQPRPPDGPKISGVCGLDQTFLDDLMDGVQSLLNFHNSKS